MAIISSKRPIWDDVYNGYPKIDAGTVYENDLPASEVFKSIFGDSYNRSIYTNACATRVSIALLKAGVTIDEGIKVTHGDLKGKRVILGAAALKDWLMKKWGKADYWISRPQSLFDLQTNFNDKRGIYIMIPYLPRDFGATGHCTLWKGENTIGGHHYAGSYAYAAYVWELK